METDWRDTPSRPASSSCDQPRARRRQAIFDARFMRILLMDVRRMPVRFFSIIPEQPVDIHQFELEFVSTGGCSAGNRGACGLGAEL